MQIDMSKDLLPGDIIRRIECDYDEYVEGEDYTFDRYSNESTLIKYLFTKEVAESANSSRFEFVRRPGITTFESAKIGDRVYSIRKGWGTITNIIERVTAIYKIVVEFDLMPVPAGSEYRYTTDGKFAKDDVSQELFWDRVKITAPDKPAPKTPYRKEFIEAMKETAKAHIDGTHLRNYETCKLCCVVKTQQSDNGYGMPKCKGICPWFIITGDDCKQANRKNGLDRAQELLEWVEIYEKRQD